MLRLARIQIKQVCILGVSLVCNLSIKAFCTWISCDRQRILWFNTTEVIEFLSVVAIVSQFYR